MFRILIIIITICFFGGCNNSFIEINGHSISKQEYLYELENLKLPIYINNSVTADIFVMDKIIKEELLLQYAKKEGVYPTKKEIEKSMEKIALTDSRSIADFASKNKIKEADFRREVTLKCSMQNIMTKDVKIKEEDIKRLYLIEKNSKNLNSNSVVIPETRYFKIISSRNKKNILEAYNGVIGGESFDNISKIYNDNQGATNKEVKIYKNNTDICPMLYKIIFTSKANTLIPPIKMNNYYFILIVTQIIPGKILSYNEAKEELRKQLAIKYATKNPTFKKGLLDFIKNSNIKIDSKKNNEILTRISK